MTGKSYFAHETSCIDDSCEIGVGTKIWHFSHVMSGSTIGENCILGQNVMVSTGAKIGNGVKIQNNVSVYSGLTIEDNVFLGPSCVFTNVINPRSFIERKDCFKNTTVRIGASIGANSTILCGVDIGKYAFIGAGSVVTKDVPDYTLVYGNPARIMGCICECGNKIGFKDEIACCKSCSTKYSKKNIIIKVVD